MEWSTNLIYNNCPFRGKVTVEMLKMVERKEEIGAFSFLQR